jgi:hypothetical protein
MDRRFWKALVLLFACLGWGGCLEPVPPSSMTPTEIPTSLVTSAPAQSPSTSTFVPMPLTPATIMPAHAPAAWPVPPADEPYYEDRTGPVKLLASYYNAVNRHEYARAWAYWENPPNPSYADFVRGFGDTESVLVVVRPPTRFEGAAGSTYAAVPALLNAAHTDGSRHNFVGCFVARRPNVGRPGVDQQWSLFGATVRRSPGRFVDVTVLEQVCTRGE